jgi:hypothetical protein
MRRYCNILIIIALFASAPCLGQGPQGRPFGLGLTLGDPTGITGKYWISRVHTFDVAIGWGFYPFEGVALYGDYLYNIVDLIPGGERGFNLPLYLGVGGKIGAWHHHYYDSYHDHYRDEYGPGLGIRIPFGITMVFSRAPFDIFLELAPSIEFISPDPFWFDLDFAVGGRYYF